MSQNLNGRRRPNSRNRERDIILTAASIIHDDGFSRLNVDDLAKKVGISKSTLYQHFDHKRDIVLFALNTGAQVVSDFLASAEGSPLDRLEALLRFLYRYREDEDSSLAGIIFTEAMELVKNDDDASEYITSMTRLINSIIEEGQARGEIRQSLSCEVVSGSLFSTAVLLSSYYLPTKLKADASYVDHVIGWWRGSLA
ncbi:MAG: TetR/AcrR family transcriptional regulator [Anaerolineae bacterium]|nr:TetR/AcrR family transcriptional regulator [Anaerolineae bacterium]MCA9888244.1 TetR/AcrR family transcriptional regulator [Anaerolineae bacterium]MCA9894482.1 TetR/AcrR family transcriptional regulator [Anaerolineae bacterium]MCB9460840.1 TetR/AcrR family transcriptional regulator [Anaerolineaceae bacterium]